MNLKKSLKLIVSPPSEKAISPVSLFNDVFIEQSVSSITNK